MRNQIKEFSNAAKSLSRNPLGIIALFLVLVYGVAALVCVSTTLLAGERIILVYFLVIFPLIVLIVFYRLVALHYYKLYAPTDYKDETNYIKSIDLLTQKAKYEVDIDGLSKTEFYELSSKSYQLFEAINTQLTSLSLLVNKDEKISKTTEIQLQMKKASDMLSEIKTAVDWSKYHIAVNDLSPKYHEIRNLFVKNSIKISETFGSTSSEPEVPKPMIISFGEDIEVDNLQFFVKHKKEMGIEGFYYSKSNNVDRIHKIYVGAYSYRQSTYAKLTNDLVAQLLAASNYEEFRQLVVKNS